MFSDDRVERELDETVRRQREDGRWATNYGVSEGSGVAWDGIQTLAVLKTLRAYNRIDGSVKPTALTSNTSTGR